MADGHGWVERFHDDELIVPIPQLAVVRKALRNWGVTVSGRDIKESQALGLARLSRLKGISPAAAKLERGEHTAEEIRAYRELRRAAHPKAPEVSDLAVVIRGVQAELAREYPGWRIAIGKNYRPSVVHGDPHTDGAGHPKPHTDGAGHPKPHTDAAGRPTVTSADCAGPIVQPDPHTDIARRRTGGHPPGWGVRVGLVDTKLFPHESLDGRYLSDPGDILSSSKAVYSEFDGHATFVASCILRQAPAAGLSVRSVLGHNGDGSAWDAAVGIADLAPLGLDVVNLSFGEYMTDDDAAPMVLDAAIRLFGRDTVVVASAGNNGDTDRSRPSGLPEGVTPSTTSYPAALPGVVGVGACDARNHRAKFTPHPAPWISLLARGVDINAAYLRGEVRLPPDQEPASFEGFANWAGCSFAAGVVSGVVAARTIPGQRSAREALAELAASLRRKPWPGLLITRNP
jgi:membrane-anchored mycosin MYCP